MKNFKKLFIIAFAFMVFVLASCTGGNKVGIKASDVEMQFTTSRTSVKATVYFDKYEKIEAGKAKPLLRAYELDDENKENYHSEQSLSFSNSVYSKSKEVEFTGLKADTSYAFYLYVTYNSKDIKITSQIVKTKADGGSRDDSTLVSNVEEFKAIEDDNTGYFQITQDIDFAGEEISLFTSTTAFEGELDGGIYDDQGNLTGCHVLSNYKLTSTKLAGLFGQTSNATIKNLIIETVTDDYSSSNSDVYHGALIGKATRTIVSNVSIEGINFTYTNGSSAQHAVGGLIGFANTVNVSDVALSNVTFTFNSLRIQAAVGLFIGRLSGNTLDSDTIVSNSTVEGEIKANINYPKSTSTTVCYATIGGFIGDLGSQGLIKDCATANKIELYQDQTNERDYKLFVGGFVGSNREGSMNIKDSVAVTVIKAYAGKIVEDADYSSVLLATQEAYVGGFIGKAIPTFKGIDNSYVVYNDFTVLNCDTTSTYEDDNEQTRNRLYTGDFVGYVDDDNKSKLTNVHTSKEDIAMILSDEILAFIDNYSN